MSDVQLHKATKDGIVLTEAAKKYILSFLSTTEGCIGVRFGVKKTGCSGYSYTVESVITADAASKIFSFTEAYSIYIDEASYPFLKGVTVDYIQRGLNAKLEFINPNQTGQCGCGESFTI